MHKGLKCKIYQSILGTTLQHSAPYATHRIEVALRVSSQVPAPSHPTSVLVWSVGMQEQQYELMRPPDIVAGRDRAPICYLPLGPLEWHGPHLPFGVDMLHASTPPHEPAREPGRVVMPPLP